MMAKMDQFGLQSILKFEYILQDSTVLQELKMKLTYEVRFLWKALPPKVADLATLSNQKRPFFGLILMYSGRQLAPRPPNGRPQ